MADRESARDDGIDFVTVATPNSSHYEIAKYFLGKNIHVMCDKPVTMTVEQAEDLKRIAEERKLLFAVSYAYTGYPVIRQARRMIDSMSARDTPRTGSSPLSLKSLQETSPGALIRTWQVNPCAARIWARMRNS